MTTFVIITLYFPFVNDKSEILLKKFTDIDIFLSKDVHKVSNG